MLLQNSTRFSLGVTIKSDVLLGADGLRSECRKFMQGPSNSPVVTPDLAYRITIKVRDMEFHPELIDLTAKQDFILWPEPGAYVVSHVLPNSAIYNLTLICGVHLANLK